jgi:PAS domain S-box-containing protein
MILGNKQVDKIFRHPFLKAAEIGEYEKYKIFHKDGTPYKAAERPLARSITTGEVVIDEEIDFLRGDGTYGVMNVSSTPIKDENGRIISAVSIFKDITKSKRAEESLRKNEAKLKIAMDLARLVHWEYDFESDMFTFDDQFYKLYGTTAKEEGGTKMSSQEYARKFIPSEESHLVAEEVTKALKTDDPNYSSQIEHSIIRADGEKRFITVRIRIIKDADGRTIKAYGTNQDITERKKAEESLKKSEAYYKTIFENTGTATLIVEEDTTISLVNAEFEKLFGYSKEEVEGKKSWKEFIPDDYIQKMEEYHNIRRIDPELAPKNYEFKAIDRFGNFKDMFITTDLIPGTKQSLVSLLDITEKKEANKQLKKAINELERSNEELQQFAYVSSHDLQEPLRTIASFTQLIERRYKGKLDSDADEFMDYIVDAAVRMKQQIQDLLEYSRVTTKREEFELVDMNLVLNQTIQNLNSSIEEFEAEIIVDELPNVMGDAGQLQRVFQNLIANAIKFRKPEESPIIHISSYKDEDNHEYVFSVKDNGIGIEEQYLERIFTIFQRLHTIEEYHGTGIGLSIVKRIIERHGGRIWVESEWGVGSTFYFTIPFKE